MSHSISKSSMVFGVKMEDLPKEEYVSVYSIKKEEEDEPNQVNQRRTRNKAAITTKPKDLSRPPKEKPGGKPNSKHIIKNFGKAMCSFACSEISKPYLNDILRNSNVQIQEFQDYIRGQREIIDSMKSIRNLLLVRKQDDEKLAAYKQIFQKISIIFIKYFSVNWIFQGKMTYKQAHVNARFKILRRIQNPKHFTYFKEFAKS